MTIESYSGRPQRPRFFNGYGIKAAFLLLLGLLLLIPLSQIEGLLRERQGRQAEAMMDIGQKWGRSQVVTGPVLQLPVRIEETVVENELIDGVRTVRRRLVSRWDQILTLPKRFELKGVLEPSLRYRGIYRVPVYNATLSMGARWERPTFAPEDGQTAEIDWEKARIILQLEDARGAYEVVGAVNGAEVDGDALPLGPFGFEWIAFPAPWASDEADIDFSISLSLRGSERFAFLPVGQESEVTLESSWSDPSFDGSALPATREVGEAGFSAEWRFGEFGRGLPTQWLGTQEGSVWGAFSMMTSGVSLLDAVDGYRLTERSLKYGFLFVGLAFCIFYLFEILCGLRLHAMQYLLAGFAQALFFLLVLAISEVSPFALAYWLGAVATVVLVSLYALSVLRTKRNAWIVAGAMGVLYLTLFAILQQQDYALLTGSGLLFIALAVFMFLTRRFDWGGGSFRGWSREAESPPEVSQAKS